MMTFAKIKDFEMNEKGKERMNHNMDIDTDEKSIDTHMPWVEKYRPIHLSDVIHHVDIITTLRKFIKEGKLPHLLFYGPPGTGKTSTAQSLARDIYGGDYRGMVLELNASDERGINVVREQIKSFAATKTLSLGNLVPFKLIILDECDAMTSAAQNALRRVMEKFVKNVRFILICNYFGQIIPALQSRCTRFRFSPLPSDALTIRLNSVAESEGISLTDSAAKAIVNLSGGDMRRILNVLQASQAASSHNIVTDDLVYAVTASPHPNDLDRIFKSLMNQNDFAHSVSSVKQIQLEKGMALTDILKAMFDRLAAISIPDDMRIFLTKHLAEIEYRLAHGSSEEIQLTSIVGAFYASRVFLK